MEEHKDFLQESMAYVFEAQMARLERTIKRLFILCLVLVAVAVGTNIFWIHYEMQFEDIVTTVTQEVDGSDGGNAIINDGVHINGESKANSDSQEESA